MQHHEVEYYSDTVLIRANWRLPDEPTGPVPAIVQGPGWMGLKDAKDYDRYHEAFTAAGFGVLCIDYRGFGASEGERGRLSPMWQVEDLENAVTYLSTRDDVRAEAIGAFATGGTGGGNVIVLAARDPRIRAVVSQFPVADGVDWLRRQRREYEWVDYLKDLERDRAERVLTGASRRVHAREEVMVQTPERRASSFKADVDGRLAMEIPLSDVDAMRHYRPVDAARGLRTPVMVVGVEDDTITPLDHAEAIHQALAGPRRLLVQRHTTHYAAYRDYADRVIPRMIDWFAEHLHAPGNIVEHNQGA